MTRSRSKGRMLRTTCVATAALLGSITPAARAHLVSTELGPFYDGAAHALVSPEDLLTLIGFAILAAHAGPRAGRRLLVVLCLAWVVGTVLGFVLAPTPEDLPIGTASVILLLGLTGALRARVPTGILVSGAGIVALVRGVMNGSAVRAAEGSWLSVVGVATGVLVLGVLLSGSSRRLQRGQAAPVLRVAASWVAAIGLLMLGWRFRG